MQGKLSWRRKHFPSKHLSDCGNGQSPCLRRGKPFRPQTRLDLRACACLHSPLASTLLASILAEKSNGDLGGEGAGKDEICVYMCTRI